MQDNVDVKRKTAFSAISHLSGHFEYS